MLFSEQTVKQTHWRLDRMLGADPMNHALYFAVFWLLVQRIVIDTAEHFGDVALGVFHHVVTFDNVSVPQADLATFFKTEKLAVGFFLEVCLLNKETATEWNFTHTRGFVFRIVDAIDFNYQPFRPIGDLNL